MKNYSYSKQKIIYDINHIPRTQMTSVSCCINTIKLFFLSLFRERNWILLDLETSFLDIYLICFLHDFISTKFVITFNDSFDFF